MGRVLSNASLSCFQFPRFRFQKKEGKGTFCKRRWSSERPGPQAGELLPKAGTSEPVSGKTLFATRVGP